jgi:hypothetical protein
MHQNEIISILNKHVFNQEKSTLLKAIAESPDRFVGIFRSNGPRLKLLQNLLQSREIRFGDALEEVMSALIASMGFEMLEKRLKLANEDLYCDQYFCTQDQKHYYLIEQKVRDDHDSTKKRGQIDNFRSKLSYLKALHGTTLTGIMYFIDPSLHKNENYYLQELKQVEQEIGVAVSLCYNGQLFQQLEGHTQTWILLLNSLQTWRKTIPDQIELNYDLYPHETCKEVIEIAPKVWHKISTTEALWESEVIQTLFPTGETLILLLAEFDRLNQLSPKTLRSKPSYAQLAKLLQEKLVHYYNISV